MNDERRTTPPASNKSPSKRKRPRTAWKKKKDKVMCVCKLPFLVAIVSFSFSRCFCAIRVDGFFLLKRVHIIISNAKCCCFHAITRTRDFNRNTMYTCAAANNLHSVHSEPKLKFIKKKLSGCLSEGYFG